MVWALPFGYFGLAIMAMTWTMFSGGTVEFSGLLVLVVGGLLCYVFKIRQSINLRVKFEKKTMGITGEAS